MENAQHRPAWGVTLLRIVKPLVVALAVVSLIKLFALEAYRIPSGSMEGTLLPGDFVLVNKLAFGLRAPKRLPVVGWEVPPMAPVGGRPVRRGDVVVFEFSKDPPGSTLGRGAKLVKRVVGIPGDTVQVAASDVLVNGKVFRVGVSSGNARLADGPGHRASAEHAWSGPVVVPYKGQVVSLTGERPEGWLEVLEAEGHALARDDEGRVLVDGEPREAVTLAHDYYYVLGDNLHNSFDSRSWGFVSDRDLIGEVLMVYWSWHQGSGAEVLSAFSNIRWRRIGSLVR